jgi:membrane protease YdiL (CAAX protease family)
VDEQAAVVETDTAASIAKRLAVFLRSVIPADPWQLLFLAGTILLFISPRLPLTRPQGVHDSMAYRQVTLVAVWPIIGASLIAYYCCFWSVTRPLRRLILGVLLPAVFGVGAIIYSLHQGAPVPYSIFEKQSIFAVAYEWFSATVSTSPTSLIVAMLGLVLVTIFCVRVFFGSSTLPLTLAEQRDISPAIDDPERRNRWIFRVPDFSQETEDSWDRYLWLIFLLIGPFFLIANAFSLLTMLPYVFGLRSLPDTLFTVLNGVSEAVVIGAITFFVFGRPVFSAAKKSLTLRQPGYALFALLLATGIVFFAVCASYLVDRAQWAAFQFGRTWPPEFGTYFGWSHLWNASLLFLAVGAFAEEIVFRSILLSQLIRRYDLHRGIWLTGIIWAAVHFRGDLYTGQSVGRVLYHLAWRILSCLAMNYAFAWMTIRWGSIIPSGVTHTAYNIIVISGVTGNARWRAEYELVLWTAVAVVMFRYWTPKDEEGQGVGAAEPDSVAAV